MVMGIDSLKANLSDPARIYNWDIIIPAAIGGGDADSLMVRCQSTQEPGRSFEDIDINFKQTGGFRVPGRLRYTHDWACTFIEGEDRATFEALYNWMQSIVHDTDGTGLGDPNIKMDLLLSMVTTKGDEYQRIKMVGCYPKAVADIALAFDNSAQINFAVTWSYDYWQRVG